MHGYGWIDGWRDGRTVAWMGVFTSLVCKNQNILQVIAQIYYGYRAHRILGRNRLGAHELTVGFGIALRRPCTLKPYNPRVLEPSNPKTPNP